MYFTGTAYPVLVASKDLALKHCLKGTSKMLPSGQVKYLTILLFSKGIHTTKIIYFYMFVMYYINKS